MEQKMFCYQCQETAGCRGCTMVGVCGKQPDVAAMQDLLVYVSRGISAVTTALRKEGKTVAPEINHLITLNLFTTITNANFDRESIEARIRATLEAKAQLLAQLGDTANLPQAALWDGAGDWEEKAKTVGVLSTENEDIRSLRELITYGLKGLSAYSKHANALLQDDGEVDAFLQKALAATLDDGLTADDLTFEDLPNPFLGSRDRKLYGLWPGSEALTIGVQRDPVAFDRTDNGTPVPAQVFRLPATEAETVDYNVYMGGDVGETVIETGRPDLPSILIYGDSFTNPVECLAYYSFDEMRSIDLRHYKDMTLADYIQAYQPDIVVGIRDYEALLSTDFNGSPFQIQP